MADVALRNVVKKYDDVVAVSSINLDIPNQEFIVLVGPSGCGKSTTLRMIAGLEEISGGEISIGGDGGQRPAAEGPRHRHGVPELRALSAHDRVREHGVRPQAAQFPQGRDQGARRPRRRHSRHHRAAGAPPQAALRRPAPARRHGPRHRAQAQGVPLRRAAVQSRRQIARADAHRNQARAPEAEHHHRLRHPRPGRGHDHGRPRRGHERRQDRADRHAATISITIRRRALSPASSVRRP